MSKKSILFIILLIIVAIIFLTFVKGIIEDNKKDIEKVSFNALVIENMGNSILVTPNEGSLELNSSDKIVVRVPVDNATLKDLSEFIEGSRVKITYDGIIMESYPAQINAYDVELIS